MDPSLLDALAHLRRQNHLLIFLSGVNLIMNVLMIIFAMVMATV